MTIRLNPRWLMVSTLLFSLQFGRAQVVVLPPTLSFDLGTSDAPESQLWDLNGNYVADLVIERNGLALPVQVQFTLIQSPGGQLSSSVGDLANAGVVLNNDENSAFAANAKITGKVTGFAGIARVHFTVRFGGNGFLAGQASAITGSFNVDAEVDSTSGGQLLGTKLTKFSASFPGAGSSVNGKSDFAANLPAGVNGSWNLTMHLVGLNKLTGSAIVTTPSQPLGLDLTGKFKNQLVVANAVGASDVPNALNGAGCSGTILVPSSFDAVQFNGKLLGQKMSFNVGTGTGAN